MPPDKEAIYTLTELADIAGVTVRTVRYYISQGLLAVDASPGPGPKYDDIHVARLRLIKRLQAEHQPLAEIRHRLEGVSDAEVLAFAGESAPAQPDSALDYIRNLTAPAHPAAEAAEAPVARSYASRALLMRDDPTESAAPTSAASHDPATRLERSQWERIDLAPDVELHVRRPLARQSAKQVDRIISIARDLFDKENPS